MVGIGRVCRDSLSGSYGVCTYHACIYLCMYWRRDLFCSFSRFGSSREREWSGKAQTVIFPFADVCMCIIAIFLCPPNDVTEDKHMYTFLRLSLVINWGIWLPFLRWVSLTDHQWDFTGKCHIFETFSRRYVKKGEGEGFCSLCPNVVILQSLIKSTTSNLHLSTSRCLRNKLKSSHPVARNSRWQASCTSLKAFHPCPSF